MIHIAICDSDVNETNKLKNEIINILDDKVWVTVYNNPFALVTHIVDEVKGQVDIIFMEVCFNNQDGVYIAETILNEYPHIKIIFMTSFIEKVKDIFRVNPVYFLTKPVEYKYLRDALDKTVKMLDESNADILRIGNGIGKNRILIVKMSDVYYIKSDRRKITFYQENTNSTCYMKLDEVGEYLGNNFIRVHQSYIVNMDKIKEVSRGNIVLKNNMVIPISSSKHKTVMERVKNHMEIY